MKQERHPERDETGRYAGSIAQQSEITPQQMQEIRKLLGSDKAPMHLSNLASAAGVNVANAAAFSSMVNYVENVLAPHEAEMSWEDKPPTRTGRAQAGKLFVGWRGTPKLRELLEKGL